MRHDGTWGHATVVDIRQLTGSVRELTLRPEHMAGFLPGSHVDVRVSVAGCEERRSYSLIGGGESGCYRIAVKLEPQGRGGSRFMWSLVPGAILAVSSPSCNFELLQGAPEYLLVAGGIGITPLIGMASALASQGPRFQLL